MANVRRGLLDVTSELRGRSAIDVVNGRLPSRGGEQAFSELAQGLNHISNRIGALADHAAAKEGEASGLKAGMAEDFQPSRALTIRGEAYDRAGIATYKSRLHTNLRRELEEIYDRHSADPAGLKGVLDKARGKWSKQVFDEIRPDFEATWSSLEHGYLRQARHAWQSEVAAKQRAALSDEIAVRLRTLEQQGYLTGLDANSDKALALELEGLGAALGARGPDGKPLVDAGRARGLLEAAKQDLVKARALGAFSRLPDLESKGRFIDGLQQEWAEGKGALGGLNLDQAEGLLSRLKGELRSDRAGNAAATAQLKGEVKSFADLAGKGFALPSAELTELKTRALASGDAGLQAMLEQGTAALNFHEQARKATPAELENWVSKEQSRLSGTGGATPAEVERLDLGKTLLSTMRAELGRDPLGWAERVGVLAVPPLDPTNPNSFKARAAVAETVSSLYGVAPQIFRPGEVEQLSGLARKGTEAVIGFTHSIVQGLGPKAPAALREIGKDAPELAALGGLQLADGNPVAIRDAAAGLVLRRSEGYKPPELPKQKVGPLVDDAFGQAFSALPATRDAIVDLAGAIYDVRARRAGKSEFDESLFEAALNEAAGARTVAGEQYGGLAGQKAGLLWGTAGRKVFVPPEVKAAAFEDVVDEIRDTDLEADEAAPDQRPRDGTGKVLGVRALKRSTLVSLGHGRYWAALGDPDGDDPQWLAGADGQRYVLDLKPLLPRIRDRRPDYFLGGE